jgi:hypothetical protein
MIFTRLFHNVFVYVLFQLCGLKLSKKFLEQIRGVIFI